MKNYKNLIFAVGIILFSAFSAITVFANPLDDAYEAYLKQDYAKAFELFELSAEQGYANAQYNLAVMYAEGEGVAQNYKLAHMWFNIASSLGHKNAAENRDIVAEQLSKTQLEEAQMLAQQCLDPNYQNCG